MEAKPQSAGRAQKVRIGDVLVAEKIISAEQLQLALEAQKRSGKRLGRVLVEQGIATEEQIASALARQLNIPFVNLKLFNTNAETVRRLPEGQARRFRALVLEDRKASFFVGMADPTDLFAYDEIARMLKREVELAVVSEVALLQAIDRVYRRTEEIAGFAKELEKDLGDSYVDFGQLGAGVGAEEAPVVKMLQSMFEDAVQVNASDVHIEPQEARVQIRFRIDGVLMHQAEVDRRTGPALAQRLKLISGLDISEKRLPQDGRFNVAIREQAVDVRISTMPTQFGESVVMRLLSRRGGVIRLDSLGIPDWILGPFREALETPSGMILVTGPTGSGKTTTLYAALSELNVTERKIITVEDPVEYRLAGINQVQVNEKIDLSFSRVLRATLRQDPDVILVGEMRDEETAQIGLRAALTGHLVLSTLHTRDAAGTPVRLIDMGAPGYMVASSLRAVVAQRLVRVICESCKEEAQPEAHDAKWLATMLGEAYRDHKYHRGRGCSHCNGSGFQGRTGVYEMLEMTTELAMALHNTDPREFSDAARKQLHGHTLAQHASHLVITGKTTPLEAARAVAQSEE
jgi:MSHA biogenesis protein MshE